VTKDQIERARQFPVLDYVMRYEADQYKRVGRGYRLKNDDAFAVGENGWYCHKNQIGSRTALDYLVKIKGYGLVDAVCFLLGERPHEHGDRAAYTPKPKARSPTKSPPRTHKRAESEASEQSERATFVLPRRHKDNRRVIAYLQSRGIDKDIILECISRGSLYEGANWHNCVFTGKDENGKTRFAALRSTTTSFKGDADGSDKRYGFILPPENPKSHEVAIFEAPINCLSHQTLCKQEFIAPFDGWRLSLSGTSDLALKHFLKTHAKITHCVICTDNDDPGNAIAAKIAAIPGITAKRSPPTIGSDWNDTLQAMQKAERTQNRVRKINTPDL